MHKLDIIICTYNNKDSIGKCLDAVRAQSFKKYTCTVVDDASSDGTADFVKKTYKWVKVIQKKENSGPSINRNMGIKSTHGKYVVVMDSDVFLTRNWLKEQVKLMDEDSETGIVGSKLIYASNKNKLNSVGGALMTCGIGFDVGSGEKSDSKKFSEIKQYVYVCSAAMIIRRSMLQKIGQFDNTFFYGHEDTDLGWRANIAGWTVFYNPKAVAYHSVSETMRKRSSLLYYYAAKNRIRSVIKNYEWFNVIRYLALLLILTLGDIIFRPYRLVKLKALWWNITHLGSTLKERKKVQKTRKKFDFELAPLFASSWNVFKK